MSNESTEEPKPLNFIEEIIEADLASGKNDGQVLTRFPPEPNGFLHIGHAKAICISFGLAEKYGGRYNLRFDDTNPEKEDTLYVEAIKEDITWLGFDPEGRIYFASSYFETMYEHALTLIQKGLAYVESLSAEEISEYRGTAIRKEGKIITPPGRESPYRDRPVEESLDLFARMRAGEFPDGAHVLRAKIDMAHPNLNMRDPIMYRISHTHHHRTGDDWCIYPMYDWAHGLEDSIEGITHSLCDLSFENHRPLYDWFLSELGVHHPQQIEFAKLNLTYTVLSKRNLLKMVEEGIVNGWDDPRLLTLSGMRRRGITPSAIRDFCGRIGVAKTESRIDIQLLTHCLREDLNKKALRVMGVLNPLKVVITNYPEGQSEELNAINNPEDESAGTRTVPFGRELWIEREDFMEDPPKKFFRLGPGREVRFRYAYFLTCTNVVKDAESGEVTEIHCTYDPETRGGDAPDGRKVKGTIHWVSAAHAKAAEVRLYDHLFTTENPGKKSGDWHKDLNPDSLKTVQAWVEPSAGEAQPGVPYQFERVGYFTADPDSRPEAPVFNRTATLRDSWGKKKK
ncbi:MAG: glutamine--tRNA ligase/YqeY domain fusion protein [Planctomycetota bacterium]|jgi:glutaminyl-tRNA synthetase